MHHPSITPAFGTRVIKIKGFCQKWEVKFSYVQNWLAFAKVGGTVKSKYGQACTSGT